MTVWEIWTYLEHIIQSLGKTVWLPLYIIIIYVLFNIWALNDVFYLWSFKDKDLTLRIWLKCWFGLFFFFVHLLILSWVCTPSEAIVTYNTFSGVYPLPDFEFIGNAPFLPGSSLSYSDSLEWLIEYLFTMSVTFGLVALKVVDNIIVFLIIPLSEPVLNMVDQSYSLSGFNMPANETMFSLIAIYTETLGVCLLVLFVVSILLAYILDHFVVKDLLWIHSYDTTSHGLLNTWNEELLDAIYIKKLRGEVINDFDNEYGHDFSDNLDIEMNSKVFRYPHVFTKEAESLLDVFFLIIPTWIIIYLLMHTVGFVYSNDINHEKLSTSFDLDIIASQWYWSYGYNLEFCNSWLLSLLGEEGAVYEKIQYDSIILTEDDQPRLSGWMEYIFMEDEFGSSHCLNINLIGDNSPYIRLLSVDKSLVIPVNVYVNCFITSEDVIHSWSMPQLGVKVDAIPGRITNFLLYSNYTGVYYGQCSELCGVLHGFMPIELVVSTSSDFFVWMATLRNVEVDLFDGTDLSDNDIVDNTVVTNVDDDAIDNAVVTNVDDDAIDNAVVTNVDDAIDNAVVTNVVVDDVIENVDDDALTNVVDKRSISDNISSDISLNK